MKNTFSNYTVQFISSLQCLYAIFFCLTSLNKDVTRTCSNHLRTMPLTSSKRFGETTPPVLSTYYIPVLQEPLGHQSITYQQEPLGHQSISTPVGTIGTLQYYIPVGTIGTLEKYIPVGTIGTLEYYIVPVGTIGTLEYYIPVGTIGTLEYYILVGTIGTLEYFIPVGTMEHYCSVLLYCPNMVPLVPPGSCQRSSPLQLRTETM